MKFLLLCTFSLLAIVLASQGAALAEDYASFSSLPEIDRSQIVGELQDRHQWGLPEQKPICRDLLVNQGYSAIAWTVDAIDLAERAGWKDLTPLIAKIYDRPKNIWVYERAFRYLRSQSGRPISTNVIAAARTLRAAGYYRSTVSVEQLNAAINRLLQEDKETVMVYAIKGACGHAGKGDTERGREASASILKRLDPDLVVQRLRQLRQDCPDPREIEWVAHYLGVSLEDGQK